MKKGQSSIKCYNCKKFIDGPIDKSKALSCSLLTLDEFNIYTNPSIYKSWICPKCCANEFPFRDVCTNALHLENIGPRNPKGDINIILDKNIEDFVNECNLISVNTNDEQTHEDLYNNINYKYYCLQDSNKINKNISSSIGICHTNIASLSKHIDELKLTLSLLRNEFHINAITEHKIWKGVDTLVNVDIPGYKPFIFDAAETNHGGIGFYVKESLQIKVRDDWKFNSPGNFESTFI